MNNRQVVAARRVLNPHQDRVKLSMSRDGATTTMTPYLIETPSTRGEPVQVIDDITGEAEIGRTLGASIRGILG